MNFMRRFPIRLRMMGAIMMVSGLLTVLGCVGLWSLSRLSTLDHRFVSQTYSSTVSLTALRLAISDMRQAEKDMVIAYEKTEAVAAHRRRWDATLERARREAAALAGLPDNPHAGAARRVQQSLAAYVERATPILRQIHDGAYDTAPVADRMLNQAKTAVQEAENEMDQLLIRLADEARTARRERIEATRFIQITFVAAVLLSIAFVLPTTLMNSHSICVPLAEARSLADAIAASDLTRRVAATGRDETADMLRSLDHMQASLAAVVGQVRASADAVQLASAEVASGNDDLSHRTERAAANIQQTASSMGELTAQVRQSADAATQANELVSAAYDAAQRGGAVVEQVVLNMQDISQSSHRIAEITALIDSIAFQTNILALNAAVEAARAGEQGRGFAVVAGEVRSLAHNSAEAARQIKHLIASSAEKVASGRKLAGDAGTTMNDIVVGVQRVSGIIGRITAAASEQSQRIGQINGSVSQLDQMTQQNAALVEQSASAAASLKEEAARLSQVVATFRLAGGTAGSVFGPRQPSPA
jgi:methyl-accepting chemotaxis protein